MTTWVFDDGGRERAGFATANDAGDCVVRAIAIAGAHDYRWVYDSLADLSAAMGGRRSARDGIDPKVYREWLDEQGWHWVAAMSIGAHEVCHLRADELPGGRIITRLSKHLCAVIDGMIHDTADPSRGGTRLVYGWWEPPALAPRSPR